MAADAPSTDHDLDKARQAILDAALELAPFEGWSVPTLRRAASDAGYDRPTQLRAFPRGVIDLIDLYTERCDARMEEALAALDLDAMRIREKVTVAVRARIEAMADHKQAAHKAMQFLALPMHAPDGMAHVARTADRIWRAIGDTSTDFNYYTKRATLSLVYSSTVLVWFDDTTPDHAETWAFLDRRIENVMSFEKVKAKARDGFSRMPSPLGVLAGLRYPGPRPRR